MQKQLLVCLFSIALVSGCYNSSTSDDNSEIRILPTTIDTNSSSDSDSETATSEETEVDSNSESAVIIDSGSSFYLGEDTSTIDTSTEDTVSYWVDTTGISDSDSVLDTNSELEDTSPPIEGCYPSDFELNTEDDIAAISNYECISGDLTIIDTVLSNISLPVLQRVYGKLRIYNNTLLSNLQFPSLIAVEDDLVISAAGAVSSLAGFGTVQRVEGNLVITDNPLLENATGFVNLILISGRVVLNGNPILKSFNLPSTTYVDDTVQVSNCPMLTELRFPLLLNIGGLSFGGLGGISIFEVPLLTSVMGNLYISGCTFEADILMSSVEYVSGNIGINGNTGIKVIDLDKLFRVQQSIQIAGNSALTSLKMGALSVVDGENISITANALIPYCQLCSVFYNDELSAMGAISANLEDDCCSSGKCVAATELICP